jgi:GNAT superfamily N-acetyltransferase
MTGTPSVGTDAEGNPTLDLATARDGTVVHLRPLRRDERELVARFFAGLSAESRRRRFLTPMPRLPEAMLRRLVDVDSRRHVAMLATVEGQCAGIARYIALADEPGAAEVAVTVTDRYQRRGIGRLLVDALRPAAVRAGITTLVYLVEPTNRPALWLLRSLDVELAFRDGLVQGRQHLPASRRRTCRAARASATQWTSPPGGDPSNGPQGGTGHGRTQDDHPAPRRRGPASTQHPATSGVAPVLPAAGGRQPDRRAAGPAGR